MQLTDRHATRRTPDGASRLAPAMPAWSVTSRRAPFSRHCRDARLDGFKTTAVHEMSTPPTHTHTNIPEALFSSSVFSCGVRKGLPPRMSASVATSEHCYVLLVNTGGSDEKTPPPPWFPRHLLLPSGLTRSLTTTPPTPPLTGYRSDRFLQHAVQRGTSGLCCFLGQKMDAGALGRGGVGPIRSRAGNGS